MSEDTFRWVITGGVAIATLCILVMAGVIIALYSVIKKVQTKVESVTARVEPIIDTVRRLADENASKISSVATSAKEIAAHATEIAANAKDISYVAKDQAHRFAELGRDIADRTQAKAARVDAVVDHTVEKAQVAGSAVKDAVMKPVREASGVLAGVKAAMATFASGGRPSIDHITQDEEMFI